MNSLFQKTVAAICDTVAAENDTKSGTALPFVLRQWQRMPRFLRLPLREVTVAFDFSGLVFGNMFHRLSSERRRDLLQAWRTSRIGPLRDFVRFYRTLIIMAEFSFEAEHE